MPEREPNYLQNARRRPESWKITICFAYFFRLSASFGAIMKDNFFIFFREFFLTYAKESPISLNSDHGR